MNNERETDVVLCVIAFLIGCAYIKGVNPFAVAYIVAVMFTGVNNGVTGAFAIIGSVFALITIEDVSVRQVMTTIIPIAVCQLILKERLVSHISIRKRCIMTVVCMWTSYMAALYSGDFTDAKMYVVPCIAVAFVVIFYYGTSMIHNRELQHPSSRAVASFIIIMFMCLYGIPDWENDYISVKLTLLLLVVLFAGYCYGVGAGALAGILCAIVVGKMSFETCVYITVFSIGGICAGVLRKLGALSGAVAYVSAIVALNEMIVRASDNVKDVNPHLFGATVAAGVLFVMLPLRKEYILGEGEKERQTHFNDVIVNMNTKKKLMDMSHELAGVSLELTKEPNVRRNFDQNEIYRVMEDVMVTSCNDCDMRDNCLGENYGRTMNLLGGIIDELIKGCDVGELYYMGNDCVRQERLIGRARTGIENLRNSIRMENYALDIKEAIAAQIKQLSLMIEKCATGMPHPVDISYAKRTKLVKELLRLGAFTDGVSVLEQKDSHFLVTVRMKRCGRKLLTLGEVADVISKYIKRDMIYEGEADELLLDELSYYVFIQKPVYNIVAGVARASSDKESVNGDNFTIMNCKDKNYVMAISDGVGTGADAYTKSNRIIDMLEHYVEAGFQINVAVGLINSLFSISDENNYSTIDVININRYTGVCNIVKAGAPHTFIKRRKWVDVVSTESYPTGMIDDSFCDTIVKKLYLGDYVVMLSDGVSDCFAGNFDALKQFILGLKEVSASKMASVILEYAKSNAKGRLSDDMTVLVAMIGRN